jgi:hypothetical protein
MTSEERHHCPFKDCKSAYKTQKGVRNHLIQIVGSEGFGPVHKKEDPLWAQLKEEGFMQVMFSKDLGYRTDIWLRWLAEGI